jgi:hypothetical protein
MVASPRCSENVGLGGQRRLLLASPYATIGGMGSPAQLHAYPLCKLFLSGYLAKKQDPVNFPTSDPDTFRRYEELFKAALQALGLQPQNLRKRPEFNFDSGDAANLESAIAVLRAVVWLKDKGFVNIALIKAKGSAADISCERKGQKVCCEVKSITKQSSGREGYFLEEQVYEKVKESISKARSQLKASALQSQCKITIAVFVLNWFLHSLTLDQGVFQQIVNRLEQEQELQGVDGVLFITAAGVGYDFFCEATKSAIW